MRLPQALARPASPMIRRLASSTSSPSSEISALPELIAGPSPVNASPSKSSGGRTVRTIGRSNVRANSQSRWSWPGHRHDRAGAVVGQHVVGRVDRDPPSRSPGWSRARPGRRRSSAGRWPAARCRWPCGPRRRYASRAGRCSSVTSSSASGASAATTKKVAPNSVSGRVVKTVTGSSRPSIGEVDVRALGAADPVALHRDHPVRPGVLQRLHVVQQPLRVVGDLEVPLGQLALGDLGAAALAHALHDLLVGQHGLVVAGTS